MKRTKRAATAKTVTVTDPAKTIDPSIATATFTMGRLRVVISLDGQNDNVQKQTAVEATRRIAHRLTAWSQVVALAPRDAASAERMAAMITESDQELAPAIRVGVATVLVKK
jgi:hypothetical protein